MQISKTAGELAQRARDDVNMADKDRSHLTRACPINTFYGTRHQLAEKRRASPFGTARNVSARLVSDIKRNENETFTSYTLNLSYRTQKPWSKTICNDQA